MLPKFNTQVSRETLLDWGFQKLVQEFDDHESSREGLGYRILEPKIIAQHFADCGLDPDIANHNHISGLSGGQKVKVVIGKHTISKPLRVVFCFELLHLGLQDSPLSSSRCVIGGRAEAKANNVL